MEIEQIKKVSKLSTNKKQRTVSIRQTFTEINIVIG